MASIKLTNVNNLPSDYHIILVQGEENELKQRALNHYKETLVTDENIYNLEQINLSITKLPAKDIVQTMIALPFLGDGRVIIIDGVDALTATDQKELADNLKNVPKDNILIFRTADGKVSAAFQKEADKLGVVIECSALSENEASSFIVSYLKTYNQTIEPRALNGLISRVGTSLKRLTVELEKVSIFVGDGGNITDKHIQELTTIVSEESVFILADAVSSNDSKKVVEVIKNMLDDNLDDPFQIFPMVVRQYRMIWQAKVALDAGWRGSGDNVKDHARASSLLAADSKFVSASPWQQRKFADLARRMSWEKLRYIYRALLECDMAGKAIEGVVRQNNKLALELLCEKIATFNAR